MSSRIQVLSFVDERLKKLQENTTGELYGILEDSNLYILGFSIISQCIKEEEKGANDLITDDLLPHLPAGVTLCGSFVVSGETNIENVASNNTVIQSLKTFVTFIVNPSSKEITVKIFEDGSFKKSDYVVINKEDVLKSFVHLRLTASVLLSCDFQYNFLQESLSLIKQKVDANNAAFHIDGSNIYLLGSSSDDVRGISPESTIKDLFSLIKGSDRNEKESGVAVLNVSMFFKGTNNETTPQLAPIIKYVKKKYKHTVLQLPLDTLAAASKSLQIKNLYQILVESLCRNLKLNEKSLLTQLKSNGIKNFSLPQTYHFFLEPCGHFISIAYPSKETIDQLKKTRESFHALLSLPMDRPFFRQSNAYDFSSSDKKNNGKILLNPHEGLASSGVVDGDPCFTQGLYAYYHYMQDNFDDSGWGCAYRSLQTIFSWFRFQGYVNTPVPTHKEIQQCLVNIGDKPASFVGSKQWIGSTEVGFVLDTLLGVSCRILNVSSGEEISMKGGELCYHFKTQGTPIMIGGGVLAHTIIGVDYNKKTGDIKFLILDPHYTGEDDIKIIQSKGWCGWKGPDFWKKNSFYNMCLPIRPKCV